MNEKTGDVTEKEDSPTTKEETDESNVEKTEEYNKLIEYGMGEKVSGKLVEIYKTGKLTHADLDERALDALKEFPLNGALSVLTQFLDSNLEHVSNKSAYLCGIMKTYRQKTRAGQGSGSGNVAKAPNEDMIKSILERTGYTLDVTTGQRKYGGPPPGWEGPGPGNGCEVFCGKIPKDIYEDELIPLFEKCGTIWDLRLMMDPMTGLNRGYAFITFTDRESAQKAVRELDNQEIKPSKSLKVNISVPNLRLFVGNIPKTKGKDEILEEFGKLTAGITEVIIYSSPNDKKKNRGFCFLEYETHKIASLGKKRLTTGRTKVWGCDIIVDWADPQEEPDEATMLKVKVLYVRNLTQDCSEENLKESFEAFGNVERVKKIKDYAFIHFEDRDNAITAMNELNGKEMCGSSIEISLAKPPSDKKKKEEILRARERRMMQMMRDGYSPQHPNVIAPGGIPLRGPGGPGPHGSSLATATAAAATAAATAAPPMIAPIARGEYDYDYEYYCYGGYSDPYYDDYYPYEDVYFYYLPPPPPARGRARQCQSTGRGARGGVVTRGRAGGPPARGAARGGARTTLPITTRGGGSRGPMRGKARAKGNVPAGKRKFDGSYQNQGDTKRHYQNGWGNQPLPQQPLGNAYGMAGVNGEGYNPGGDQQWYPETYLPWN